MQLETQEMKLPCRVEAQRHAFAEHLLRLRMRVFLGRTFRAWSCEASQAKLTLKAWALFWRRRLHATLHAWRQYKDWVALNRRRLHLARLGRWRKLLRVRPFAMPRSRICNRVPDMTDSGAPCVYHDDVCVHTLSMKHLASGTCCALLRYSAASMAQRSDHAVSINSLSEFSRYDSAPELIRVCR